MTEAGLDLEAIRGELARGDANAKHVKLLIGEVERLTADRDHEASTGEDWWHRCEAAETERDRLRASYRVGALECDELTRERDAYETERDNLRASLKAAESEARRLKLVEAAAQVLCAHYLNRDRHFEALRAALARPERLEEAANK